MLFNPVSKRVVVWKPLRFPGLLFHPIMSWRLCEMKVVSRDRIRLHVGKGVDVPSGMLGGEFKILQFWWVVSPSWGAPQPMGSLYWGCRIDECRIKEVGLYVQQGKDLKGAMRLEVPQRHVFRPTLSSTMSSPMGFAESGKRGSLIAKTVAKNCRFNIFLFFFGKS